MRESDVVERGRLAVEPLPDALVTIGLSLGVLPAQQIARTRLGVRGALLLHGCVPPSEFGGWPHGLPAQVHTMEGDELGDVEVARALAADVAEVELLLHPGDAHLFTDASLPVHDAAATDLVVERALAFLARVA